MIRFFLPLILLSTFAAAQTVGQYEIRKRGASGFTSYGVTLSNGQVFGQTAGSPAAITPFGGAFSDLSGKPTTLNGYGITDGLSTSNNLSDLANAATARTNLGLGAAATLATSTGGNYTADGGKALIFGSFGEADMSRALTIHRINSGGWLPGVLQLEAADNVQAVLSPSDGMGSFQTFTLPAVGGTLITTGNLASITTTGTITSGTWNGTDIALAYIAQGGATDGQAMIWDNTAGTWEPGTLSSGLTIGTTTITGGTAGRLLTSGETVGELTLGSGVSTWLITPSSANLQAALTDETGTGSAVFATSPILSQPTISASLPQLTLAGADYGGGGVIRVNSLYTPSLNFNFNGGNSSAIINSAGFAMNGGTFQMTWGATLGFGADATMTALIARIGNDWLGMARTTNAQRWSVFNTYTSATNHEACVIDWQTTVNSVRVGTVKGSGGGTARQMIIQTDGVERIRITAGGDIFMTLPTTAGASGRLWNDGGTVKVAP
jgi:hypothetical protein